MTNKIITIHQPDFIPWPGFFERWARSDLYIALDDVQFLRRGWHHRDKIRSFMGSKWITVPVKKKGNFYQEIKDVQIDTETNWSQKHLNLIYSSYKDSPYFDEIYADIENIYSRKHKKLMDLNIDFLNFIANKLNITTPVILASKLDIRSTGTQRIVHLADQVDASIYVTGLGSKTYLDETLFHDKKIQIYWHHFNPACYKKFYKEFSPDLSIIDLLMMNSAEQITSVIKTNQTGGNS